MTSQFLNDDRFAIAVPEAFVALLSNVSDAAFVTARSGMVEDLIWNIDDLTPPVRDRLVGRPFEDLVTEESRPKVRQMIEAVRGGEPPRWRELNQLLDGIGEIPMRYQAIPAGDLIIFLGREMRSVAAMQARLVEAQRALDEDYDRLRQLETRYRVLFQTSAEPLLIVGTGNRQVQEANAAAARLFDREPETLTGQPLEVLFAEPDRPRLRRALEQIATSGETGVIEAALAGSQRTVELRATIFRAADKTTLLCRLSTGGESREEAGVEDILARMVDRLPDAVVLTDAEGRIVWCNDAFLGFAELVLASHARGQPLARFLGRPGVDVGIIIANAREHGRLRAFSSVLRGAFGTTTQVEISVASLPEGSPPLIGFVMRDISRFHQLPERRPKPRSPDTVEDLMHLVGTVPLKELIRASTEEIEKMCIESALKLTGNNRASAAEMLGLSRQSLYVKLRRFGFMDQAEEE